MADCLSLLKEITRKNPKTNNKPKIINSLHFEKWLMPD